MRFVDLAFHRSIVAFISSNVTGSYLIDKRLDVSIRKYEYYFDMLRYLSWYNEFIKEKPAKNLIRISVSKTNPT